ncbi:galactose-binding lectin-like [Argopecten irradians]|uniref:galactose-binding lectin-like n=1 Tax=Argopecten irradians TaxID=31199 RepID=UPI0037216E14
MSIFVIKHKSGGKFIHPYGGDLNPPNDTRMVVHQDIHAGMHFAFEKARQGYGYIRHVGSGKYLCPLGGNLNPDDKTDLVLHQDRHPAALFYINARNHHIRHHGGKYIHTKGGHPNPANQIPVVLRAGRHAAMEFVIVSPCNTNQEVNP